MNWPQTGDTLWSGGPTTVTDPTSPSTGNAAFYANLAHAISVAVAGAPISLANTVTSLASSGSPSEQITFSANGFQPQFSFNTGGLTYPVPAATDIITTPGSSGAPGTQEVQTLTFNNGDNGLNYFLAFPGETSSFVMHTFDMNNTGGDNTAAILAALNSPNMTLGYAGHGVTVTAVDALDYKVTFVDNGPAADYSTSTPTNINGQISLDSGDSDGGFFMSEAETHLGTLMGSGNPEVDQLTLSNSPFGGTFTIDTNPTSHPQTVNYNPGPTGTTTGASLQAAMNALSTADGLGTITVSPLTGSPSYVGPFTIAFTTNGEEGGYSNANGGALITNSGNLTSLATPSGAITSYTPGASSTAGHDHPEHTDSVRQLRHLPSRRAGH